MAAGNWVDWNTGDLVTAAAFQDIQDSIVFIYADETAANAALTNKVQGTIFYDTTADVLKAWDGSAWISAETGDISAVTAGDGLSGGGSSGDVTLDLDLNELTAASVDVANDSIAIVDATDNSSKKESIADLATAMADGSTITASAGVLSAASAGGIEEVDIWYLTTDFTGDANPISSNLSRWATTWEKIGTGMTESSGTFSFPSTGKWQIEFIAKYTTNPSNAAERNVLNYIQVTTDNSTYSQYAASSANMYSTATSLDSGAYTAVLLDVTDIANIKVRFEIQEQAGTTKTSGNASQLRTFMTFIKLGDT